MVRHHHSAFKEGIVAGSLGAVAVALWFLAVDLTQGRPLFTPSVLGQIVLLGQRQPVADRILPDAVALYSVFHVAAFILFGIGVTRLVHLAVNVPIVRFGLVMLFVVFEVFFWGFTYVFFEGTRGLFPRGSILGANTVAAVVMAVYLWRRHPALKRALLHEPLGM
jgi:hypothetical protein